jgi:hypothetical protein
LSIGPKDPRPEQRGCSGFYLLAARQAWGLRDFITLPKRINLDPRCDHDNPQLLLLN